MPQMEYGRCPKSYGQHRKHPEDDGADWDVVEILSEYHNRPWFARPGHAPQHLRYAAHRRVRTRV